MAEWSKAVDLRPTIFGCEGSNPSPCIPPCIWVKYTIFSHSVVVITQDFDRISIYEGDPETRIRIPVGDKYLIYKGLNKSWRPRALR